MITEAEIRKDWEGRPLTEIKDHLRRMVKIVNSLREKYEDKDVVWEEEDQKYLLLVIVLQKIIDEKENVSLPPSPAPTPTTSSTQTDQTEPEKTEIKNEPKKVKRSVQWLWNNNTLKGVAVIVLLLTAAFWIDSKLSSKTLDTSEVSTSLETPTTPVVTEPAQSFLGVILAVSIVIIIVVFSVCWKIFYSPQTTPQQQTPQKSNKKMFALIGTNIAVGITAWLTSGYWLSWFKGVEIPWTWVAGIAGITVLVTTIWYLKPKKEVLGTGIQWTVGAAIFLIVAYKIGELAGGGIDAVKEFAKRPVIVQQQVVKPQGRPAEVTEREDETVILSQREKVRKVVPSGWQWAIDTTEGKVKVSPQGSKSYVDEPGGPKPSFGQSITWVDLEAETPHAKTTWILWR